MQTAMRKNLSMGEAPPAGQCGGLRSLRQMHRDSQSATEITLDQFARDVAAQEVRPPELAEGRIIFGIPSGSLDCSCQRAKGIVLQVIYGLRHVVVATPASLVVEWMSSVLPFKSCPEFVETERTQVRDQRNSEFADAFVVQCENMMMAIYQIVPAIWAQNNGNAEFG